MRRLGFSVGYSEAALHDRPLLAALRPTTERDDHVGCASYAKGITRPGRDVQYPREQSFAPLNGCKRVKDLEALAYERHRTVSHPTNSAALNCEEAPVLRPPMR
jgi:hypothetical protein